MKNYQVILAAIASFYIGFAIIDGTAQQYVHFAGPLNELGCAVIALTMGLMFMVGFNWKSFFTFLNSK